MELSLYKCDIKDLEQLSSIARETFIAAFAHLNDPVDFKNYMETAFSDDTLRTELLNPESAFYLVRDKQTIVGYFKLNFNKAQTEIQDSHACELERIYVTINHQGRGIGGWMLNKAKDMALQHQNTFMWLGVWEKNTEAIRFYEKLGYIKFGTHPYYIGSDKQTDWLMRIDLLPS